MVHNTLTEIVAEPEYRVEALEPFPDDFLVEPDGEPSQYTKLEDPELDYLSPAGEKDVDVEYQAGEPEYLSPAPEVETGTGYQSRERDPLIKTYLHQAAKLSNTRHEYHVELSQRIESARNEIIRTCFYNAHPLAYGALSLAVDDISSDEEDTSNGVEGFAAQTELLRKLDQKITDFGMAFSGRRKRTLEGYLQEGIRIAQALPLHMDYWREVCTLISSDQLRPLASKRGLEVQDVESMKTLITAALRTHDKYVASLMEANLLLVVSITKHYQHRGLELMELIQEGNLGLKIGAERFDYQRGNRFSTYATHWIRQSVQLAISNKSRTIRIPVPLIGRLYQLHRTTRALTLKLGREPLDDEIVADMGISVERLEHLRQVEGVEAETSLDAPISPGSEMRNNLVDRVAYDSEFPTGADRLSSIQMKEKLEDALDELKPIEADVLRLRFGYSSDVLTLREVGKKYRLSPEKIRRVQVQALGKLRRNFYDRGIRE